MRVQHFIAVLAWLFLPTGFISGHVEQQKLDAGADARPQDQAPPEPDHSDPKSVAWHFAARLSHGQLDSARRLCEGEELEPLLRSIGALEDATRKYRRAVTERFPDYVPYADQWHPLTVNDVELQVLVAMSDAKVDGDSATLESRLDEHDDGTFIIYLKLRDGNWRVVSMPQVSRFGKFADLGAEIITATARDIAEGKFDRYYDAERKMMAKTGAALREKGDELLDAIGKETE